MSKKEKEAPDKIQQRKKEAYERNKMNQKLAKRKIKPRVVKGIVAGLITGVLAVGIGGYFFLDSALARRTLTAATIAEEKVTPAEMSFYYSRAYHEWYDMMSQYVDVSALGFDPTKPFDKQDYGSEGQTYREFFLETAEEDMRNIHAFAREAEATGFELSEEKKAEIDQTMADFQDYAKANNMTMKQLLNALYNRGMSEDLLKELVYDSVMASEYIASTNESFTYTEEEVEKYYEDNKDTLDVMDYRMVSFLTNSDEEYGNIVTADQAKESAEALFAKGADEQAFIDASTEQAGEDISLYENNDKSSANLINEEMGEWLFNTERKVGDINMFIDDAGDARVVYVVSLPHRDESRTRNVRHILISLDNYETKEEAKAEAEKVYEEWKNGEATEDSFAALANEKSTDPGSNTNGGLYEEVMPGDMVQAFNDWLFDETRKVGDTDIVETDYGYHIMYYSGEAEHPAWCLTAEAALKDNAYTTWYEGVLAKYPLEEKWLGMKLIDEPRIFESSSSGTQTEETEEDLGYEIEEIEDEELEEVPEDEVIEEVPEETTEPAEEGTTEEVEVTEE